MVALAVLVIVVDQAAKEYKTDDHAAEEKN